GKLRPSVLQPRVLQSSVQKPCVMKRAVLVNVQRNLQAANRDDHNAGREENLAQAPKPVSVGCRPIAPAHTAPPTPSGADCVIVRQNGGGLSGAPRRGDEILPVGEFAIGWG